ncbi:tetratricopeptide repeat protein [Danxiaibacter flavus]|uniref:Tetratricopeptide repeat protein n=1 Tax=Danxiaibacter flavus TaxID=3049108 RepID=A0ABV3ZL45_9BACT|nr:tetratricopeptide repeat protein [Chitinophagaceae bacterium DXS]
MRQILVITLLFVISIECYSQQKQLDSLLLLLKNQTKEDTVRLSLLNKVAYIYYSLDPARGEAVSDAQISLAQTLNQPLMLGEGYLNKGINLSAQGRNEDAFPAYNKAADIFSTNKKEGKVANVFGNIGIAYSNISNYPKAIEYQQKALDIHMARKDSVSVAHAYNSLGVNYMFLSNYPKSLEYYDKALKIYEQKDQKKSVAMTLANIGLIYNRLANYHKALEYQKRAYAINEEMDNKLLMANTIGNMGSIYDALDSLTTAREYFIRSYELYKSLGNTAGQARGLLNIGMINQEMKKYAISNDYLNQALHLFRSINDKTNKTITLNALSENYMDAPSSVWLPGDNNRAYRLKMADAYLQESLGTAREIEDVELQSFAWKDISKLYEHQGKFNKALEAYKQFTILRDSIVNDSIKQEVTQKEMLFGFEKKEALIKADNEKKQTVAAAQVRHQKLVRNITLLSAFGVLLAAAIIFLFYKRRKDAEEQKKEADIKAQVAETEMKALRSQMNPHFIFNSLNSIGDYITRNDISSANFYLGKFAKVMRMILENSEQKEVSLADDLKVLELYMQLEAVRMKEKFSYEIIIDGDIDVENTLIPPMILQPFVENSIWHGISQKNGNGKIIIRIQKQDEMLNCIVEDNGVGFDPVVAEEKTETKRSLGMKITKARLDLLNKFKKSKASIELVKQVEGVRVEVKLPLELSF